MPLLVSREITTISASSPPELLPVADFAGVDVRQLRHRERPDLVRGVHHDREAVERHDVRYGQNALFHAGLEFGILHEARHVGDVARAVDEALHAVAAAGLADGGAYSGLFLVVVGERLGDRPHRGRAVDYDVLFGHRGRGSKGRRREGD